MAGDRRGAPGRDGRSGAPGSGSSARRDRRRLATCSPASTSVSGDAAANGDGRSGADGLLDIVEAGQPRSGAADLAKGCPVPRRAAAASTCTRSSLSRKRPRPGGRGLRLAASAAYARRCTQMDRGDRERAKHLNLSCERVIGGARDLVQVAVLRGQRGLAGHEPGVADSGARSRSGCSPTSASPLVKKLAAPRTGIAGSAGL